MDDEERPKTETELHYSEPWFHGRLVGDRATAEHALKDFRTVEGKETGVQTGETGDDRNRLAPIAVDSCPAVIPFSLLAGTFLVRESGSFTGEFTLSFVYNRQPQHCRIRKQGDQFFLTDQISFGSLYEMIEYYRRVSLKSKDFTLCLTQAVPQPAQHESAPWFHKHKHRLEAEDMLKCLDFDGAFLIRSVSLSVSFLVFASLLSPRPP